MWSASITALHGVSRSGVHGVEYIFAAHRNVLTHNMYGVSRSRLAYFDRFFPRRIGDRLSPDVRRSGVRFT